MNDPIDDEDDLTDELESADCLEDQLEFLWDDEDDECDNCLGDRFDKYGFPCTQCGGES